MTSISMPELGHASSLISVYPNPSAAQCWVQLEIHPSSHGQLRLLDALGRVLRTRAVSAAEARQPILLDTRGLSPGYYTLQYLTPDLRLSTTLSLTR